MKIILITAISLFFFSYSFSQEEIKAVLTDADVDKFAETFVPMSKELEKLGNDYKYDETNPGLNWITNAQAKLILNKYGWSETDEKKFAAVIRAYTYLKIMEEIDKMPDDERVQAEQMMPMMQMYTEKLHEDDIKTVNAKMPQLDIVFEEMEKL